MDSIAWPVALILAGVVLVLSYVGHAIRRRRKVKKYYAKVVAELRSSDPD